jgi:pyruvate dehydrogenase E2 component (dihydrolipoamide acetyltransferase)
MANAFKLPDLGEGLTEGEVARWLVAEGQEISEDDPLVEIQTDKATVEIPSPYAGTVLEIRVAEGDVAPVGAVLVVIGEPGEAVSGELPETARRSSSPVPAPSAPSDSPAGRIAATPLVRKVAQELGVDLETVTATGPGGRISDDDVRAAAAGGGVEEGRREPLRGIRRVIAEHMTRAHREVPPVTWVEECDFEDVELERLLATVVAACAGALIEFPELNARFEGDAIVYLDRYDVAVAVQTDQGLVVPVVRGADSRTVDEIDAEIKRLAEGARAGSLKPEELRGSTFTVTSAGKLAGLFQTPIVNYPEVAILSIGRIAPRAVVRDDEVVVRKTGTIAITFDHRVVDGARAAEFGLSVIRSIEGGPDDQRKSGIR